MKAKQIATTIGAVLALGASVGRADDSSDTAPLSNEVRLGVYYIHYFVKASDISGEYTPSGLGLDLKDTETLYAAYVRRLSSHFDLEVAAGAPPLTKTQGKGPAFLGSVPYNGETLFTARWLAPTVLLNYNFFDESVALRPYIGVGVNYTKFYDRDSTPQGNAVGGGPTSISLPVSVGPAVTAGLSWRITRHWNLHLSYNVADVQSTATADTAGILRTTNVKFWPTAVVASVGFSF
jgi:outer membrane protein